MSLVRTIFAALSFFAWMTATNCCLMAAAFPDKVADCCPGEESGGEMTCNTCATLENGVNLAALQPQAVPQPGWMPPDSFTALLEKLARLEADTLLEPPPATPPISPPVWRHDVTKARPVRGPSLAV